MGITSSSRKFKKTLSEIDMISQGIQWDLTSLSKNEIDSLLEYAYEKMIVYDSLIADGNFINLYKEAQSHKVDVSHMYSKIAIHRPVLIGILKRLPLETIPEK